MNTFNLIFLLVLIFKLNYAIEYDNDEILLDSNELIELETENEEEKHFKKVMKNLNDILSQYDRSNSNEILKKLTNLKINKYDDIQHDESLEKMNPKSSYNKHQSEKSKRRTFFIGKRLTN
jgi:hypothetical protein